ncbi:MAG: methylated-DNA--[protein]-cysteine S-methyltransferase [Leptolyngbya sp. SIO3F4]|nr:methylated-DNA--[protein]-cysteine S-methyltransferase [Leptolyngbya sp. SIO3F4]
MASIETRFLKTPLGTLEVQGSDEGILSLAFTETSAEGSFPEPDSYVMRACLRQLEDYFEGALREFDVPLVSSGTPFQQEVWKQVSGIPYGHTRTYGELARALGDPKKVRAVGLANGRNPHLIIVPCHRVVGVNGNLVGYAGGLERKQWLLHQEQERIAGQLDLFA